MLVLLTGDLAADAVFPTTVSFSWPEGAELNAVAAVTDQGMFNITDYVIGGGFIELTLQDPSFRLEYYTPYQRSGDDRSFTFEWQAMNPTSAFALRVQQPSAAEPLRLSEAGSSVAPGIYGLDYYNLPVRSLSPGDTLQLTVDYTLPGEALSASGLDLNATTTESPAVEVDVAQPDNRRTIGLVLIVVGAVGLVAVLGWLLLKRANGSAPANRRRPATARAKARQGSGPVDASQVRATSGETAPFCHQCGQATVSGDRFCRNCGTRLKPS